MKFLICLVLLMAAAQAAVLAPLTYTSYAAAPAYRAYTAAVPSSYVAPVAYTSYAAAPLKTAAYTTYTADVPVYANAVYDAATVAYTAPVDTYSTVLKK